MMLFNSSLCATRVATHRNLLLVILGDRHDEFKAKVGKEIVFWGYTSATVDMSVLDAFHPDGSGGTTFFIRVAYAASLAKFSSFDQNAKMVIAAGTERLVLNIMRRNGNAFVELAAECNLIEPNLFPDPLDPRHPKHPRQGPPSCLPF